MRAQAAVGVVTGIAYDSRTVDAGPGVRRAQGAARRRHLVRAPGDRARRRSRSSPSSRRRPASTCRGSIVEDARLRWRCSPTRSIAIRAGDMQVVGITGTNGKTTTAYLIASIFEAAGIRCGLLGTVALPDRRRSARSGAHDAGSAGRAAAAARDGRSRVRRVRDGSLVARAVAARVDGMHVRRRRVHQPDPRSSRFPRRHGRLLPRQAAAVRDAAARRAEPHQHRRSARRRRSSTPADGP